MRNSCAIILALLLWGTAASADDNCVSVRLDAPGGTMEKMPVLDQDRLGDCYAVVATEMFDAYRIAHGEAPERLTSPIYAALMSSQQAEGGDGQVEGGYAERALEYLFRSGGCESAHFNGKYGHKIPEVFFKQLLEYQTKILELENQRSWFGRSRNRKIQQAFKGVVEASSCINLVPMGDFEPFSMELVLQLLATADPTTYLIKALNITCPESEKITAPLPGKAEPVWIGPRSQDGPGEGRARQTPCFKIFSAGWGGLVWGRSSARW